MGEPWCASMALGPLNRVHLPLEPRLDFRCCACRQTSLEQGTIARLILSFTPSPCSPVSHQSVRRQILALCRPLSGAVPPRTLAPPRTRRHIPDRLKVHVLLEGGEGVSWVRIVVVLPFAQRHLRRQAGLPLNGCTNFPGHLYP